MGRKVSSAATTVNNFDAAISLSRFSVALGIDNMVSDQLSRTGGPGLRTTSRYNDSELIDRPVGRGLTLNDYSRGRHSCVNDSSILASPGQALRELTQLTKNPRRKP